MQTSQCVQLYGSRCSVRDLKSETSKGSKTRLYQIVNTTDSVFQLFLIVELAIIRSKMRLKTYLFLMTSRMPLITCYAKLNFYFSDLRSLCHVATHISSPPSEQTYCGFPIIYLGNSVCQFLQEVKYIGFIIHSTMKLQ